MLALSNFIKNKVGGVIDNPILFCSSLFAVVSGKFLAAWRLSESLEELRMKSGPRLSRLRRIAPGVVTYIPCFSAEISE